MDRQHIKELSLIIGTSIYSTILFWIIGHSSLLGMSPILLLLLVLASLLWVAVMAFSLAMVAHIGMTAIMTVVIPITIIAAGTGAPGAIGAALLAALLMLTIHSRLTMEIKNRIRFSTFPVFYSSVKMLTLTFMIAVAGLALAPLAKEIETSGVLIPPETVDAILKPAARFYPNLFGQQGQLTVDELIDQRMAEQSASLPAGTTLTPEERSQIRQQLASTLQTNGTLDGQDTVASLVANTINTQLNTATSTSPIISALVIIVISVSVVRLFIPVLVWPIMLIVAAIIQLARQTGFVYVQTSQQTIERLKL